MTTFPNQVIDDASALDVAVIRTYSNSTVTASQQQKISLKVMNALEQRLDVAIEKFEDNFEQKMGEVDQHLTNKLAHLEGMIIKSTTSEHEQNGGLDRSRDAEQVGTTKSTQTVKGSMDILDERITTLSNEMSRQFLAQQHKIDQISHLCQGINELKHEFAECINAVEKQTQIVQRSRESIRNLIPCVDMMLSFRYSKGVVKCNDQDGKELIKNILTCFAEGLPYYIPNEYFIIDRKRDDRKLLREKILTYLKNIIGHSPRIEDEKDGGYSLHYV